MGSFVGVLKQEVVVRDDGAMKTQEMLPSPRTPWDEGTFCHVRWIRASRACGESQIAVVFTRGGKKTQRCRG